MIFAGLSDEQIQVFQDEGELMVAGHVLSGTDLKVSGSLALTSCGWVGGEWMPQFCSECFNTRKRTQGPFTTVESAYTNALLSENRGIPYTRIIFVISTGYVLIWSERLDSFSLWSTLRWRGQHNSVFILREYALLFVCNLKFVNGVCLCVPFRC